MKKKLTYCTTFFSIPLNQKKEMNGRELMSFYEKDKHLGRFLHIIKDKYVPKSRSGIGLVVHLLSLKTCRQWFHLRYVVNGLKLSVHMFYKM